MKVPDGNNPIRVGDSSFIYKGIYHPIHWLGKDPYRPRVEMLVIKEDSIYLRLKDDIDKTPPDKRTHMYAIPGGSIDSDSSHLEQAIAETNEEALVQVTLVYNTGITYYDLYERWGYANRIRWKCFRSIRWYLRRSVR
jgi:8-oxo-dGTP pyrophosphatase MutT (NUDIX family)